MKIKEFQNELKSEKIDFALFYNVDPTRIEANMFYFSNYRGIGALVITKNKKFLIVPKMKIGGVKGIKKYVWGKDYRLFEFVKKIIKLLNSKNSKGLEKSKTFQNKNKIKTKRIAIDKNNFILNDYKSLKKYFKKIKTIDISKICSDLRKIKTNKEIKIIRKACKITDKILKKCLKNIKRFRTETDMSAFLENEAKKLGCDLAFPVVVASGKNSVVPHYNPRNIKLKKGFCVIDFGIRYNGYCSDTTRTIYLGKMGKKEKEIYNLLLNIQKNTIKQIKINKKCSSLVKYVMKSLGKYKKNLTHGLGHGLGIRIHEKPDLKEKSKDILKEGMVFTIEPGVYFRNRFGIRIEDSVLLTKKRIEVLTKVKK